MRAKKLVISLKKQQQAMSKGDFKRAVLHPPDQLSHASQGTVDGCNGVVGEVEEGEELEAFESVSTESANEVMTQVQKL